jgi:hypothetical protein
MPAKNCPTYPPLEKKVGQAESEPWCGFPRNCPTYPPFSKQIAGNYFFFLFLFYTPYLFFPTELKKRLGRLGNLPETK